MRDLFRFLHRIRDTLLFLALLALSFVLLAGGNRYHRARALTSSNAAIGTLMQWRANVADYTGLRAQNQVLAEENARWRNRHVSAYAPAEDLFVRINDTIHRRVHAQLAAKVINGTAHKQRNFLTLDKGAKAGVGPDMGVIGPHGIVGVVRAVSPHFASVISVLNPDVRTSVQLRRTGHFGLLYWDTNDPRTASVVDIAKHAHVQPGDTIETRGGDGLFPAGWPVGVVETIEPQPGGNYHDITIRLTEDMTRNGHVYVVKDLQRAERDSLQQAHTGP
ncbi:MAG: rod shape-determining protein MreC [Flavobacteriales bacterium]|jgi:rod shape-determining protein MreC|nr:rod shape-determining protein MreC [Flavobacteriales bacterium]